MHVVLLNNFALIKIGLLLTLLEIFKPVTSYFYKINQLLSFTHVFSDPVQIIFQTNGLFTMIFELSRIVSNNSVNSDPV